MTFGEKLRKLREASGLKQSEFAKKIGLTKDVYNKYENNRSRPNFETIDLICKALNISADYLIRDIQNKSTEESESYVSIIGRNGTQKKIVVPTERVEQFKKIMEATMPDIFDNPDDL